MHTHTHTVTLSSSNMENISDPSCFQEPPLALDIIRELELLWILLYSTLTLLTLLSMLVFAEQCFYVYRRFPSNRKSATVWVIGAPPFMAAMSCLALWIPRASVFADMMNTTYFALVVYYFLVMMIEECGGEHEFLSRFGSDRLQISTGPCCCCCPCLPPTAVTRRMMTILKLGSFQFALLKTLLTVLSIMLWTNDSYNVEDMSIASAAAWINPLVGILTVVALWPISILFQHLQHTLRCRNIIPKYVVFQLVLILSQLQSTIINILAMNGVIACAPPFPSRYRGYFLSEQLLILEMFIITVASRLLYRQRYGPLPANTPQEDGECAKIKLQLEQGEITA